MRRFVILLLSLLAMAVPAHAEEAVVYEVIEETIEITEFVDEGGSERFVGNAPAAIPQGIARFGPFRVLEPLWPQATARRVELAAQWLGRLERR